MNGPLQHERGGGGISQREVCSLTAIHHRFFLPLTQSHGRAENCRRCFTFTKYRLAMLVVNLAHILSIVLVTANIIASSGGGRIILPPERRE